MRIAWVVVMLGCGSSQQQAVAPPPPPPAASSPAPAAPQIAKGGDPEEGGEIAAAPAAAPAAEPSVVGSQGDSGAVSDLVASGNSSTAGAPDAGGGRGGMGGRRIAPPNVKLGEPTTKGELDTAIVRRYVKRNFNRIKFCYEKQLIQNPGLAGHVIATFVIAADGTVPVAKVRAFDATVGGCIENALRAIEYPKPKRGRVDVTYPMDFSQSQ